MHFPRILWSAEDELLNFVELMRSEYSPCVFSMGASFFSEVGAEPRELDWQVLGV